VEAVLRPVEAPLVPLINFQSFRPPAPGASTLTPKPSAAPAPRLRPTAPREAAMVPGISAPEGPPLSAADEIAGMFSSSGVREAADVQMSFDSRQVLGAGTFPAATASAKKIGKGFADPLFFRRTTIPILLTLSVVLAGWGILLVTSGQDNALPDLFPAWTPLALFSFAAIFLLLASFNILSVKNAKAAG
jgi:hypothetical protein